MANDKSGQQSVPSHLQPDLTEFFGYSDSHFVINGYRRLFGRDPEESALRGCLLFLLGNPAEGRLRLLESWVRSAEAIQRGVSVRNLDRHLSGVARARAVSPDGGTGPEVPAVEPQRHSYSLTEFLVFSDEAFVRHAYRALLKREPDGEGAGLFLRHLKSGDLSKEEIVAEILGSAEGRQAGVQIEGAERHKRLRRLFSIRFLGPVLHLLAVMANLLNVERSIRTLDRRIESLRSELDRFLRGKEIQLEGLRLDLKGSIRRLEYQDASLAETHSLLLGHTERMSLQEASAEALRTWVSELGSCKAEKSEVPTKEEFQTLRHEAVRHQQLDDLTFKVGETAAALEDNLDRKISHAELDAGLLPMARREELKFGLADLEGRKADRVELNALAQTKADAVRVDDLDARKTDRTELATGLAEKADLQGLTDLDRRKVDREELQAVAAGKADRVELALLAESKANVTWVNDIEARKTDRAEVETLMAGKADHEELRALAEAKADATWVTDLETRKSDRSEIHALAHGKLDAAEFESGRQQWIRKLQHHTESIVDLERRLTLLIEEARKRMPEPLDQRQLQTFVEQERDAIAALYVAFEDIFRGTREDIKSRQTVYLDYLQKADLKRAKTPIIDLGCGRGEWLELLQENGFLALGVDVNEVMLDRCRQLNLTVVQGDAVEYLTSLKGASVGAISGFHIAEHLPNHKLIRLMDEAFRVLRRGGMLILETPNPANLVVGSCNFYLDPTHIHPIPAPLLRFLAEARGFLGVQIMPLHPMPVTMHLAESQNSLQLNQLLYGPQDYGLICKKV